VNSRWRHIGVFAHGCGNDNPLHCDQAYAARTRWGSVIAPAMMAGSVKKLQVMGWAGSRSCPARCMAFW
jgi:acyl dehydratase